MNSYQEPPKTPLRLLRWFCSDERIEELEGDLCEVFNERVEEKGTRFSSLFYWWIVIRSFRSYAFKNSNRNMNSYRSFMMFLRHHFIVSLRDLKKNRSIAAINVLGLSIGLSAFIVIYHIITYELSFNQEIPDKERIHRVYTDFLSVNGDSFTNSGIPMPLVEKVSEDVTGLENITLIQYLDARAKIGSNQSIKTFDNQRTVLVDDDYFDIAGPYHWLSGSLENSLNQPNQVVLTEQQAKNYFGDEEFDQIIGQSIFYQDSLETIVSGIVRPSEDNSDFDFTEFISAATIPVTWLKDNFSSDDWGNTSSATQLWLKLGQTTDPAKASNQLKMISEEIAAQSDDNVWQRNFNLQPLSELHFNRSVGRFDTSRAVIELDSLKKLGAISLLLLVIAIFNFVNLETAQVNTKLKEVGVRKVIGSSRSLLLGRFIMNALIVTGISTLIAIPMAVYSLKLFSDFVPKEFALDLLSWELWAFIIGIGLFCGAVAGIYPAILISKPSVSSALRSGLSSSGKSSSSRIRKVLVVGQFAVSQFLIISTLVVAYQISYMLDKDMGFDQDGIVVLERPWESPRSKQDVLKTKLMAIPEIKQLSLHDLTPAHYGWQTYTLSHIKDSVETNIRAHARHGDTLYFDLYGVDILTGRMANQNENEVLVNEKYRKEMGYDNNRDVLGEKLGDDYRIVGVMADFHTQSLHFDTEPVIYRYTEDRVHYFGMRLDLNSDLPKTIEKIEVAWNEVYPNEVFDLRFMDQTIRQFYESERRTSKLAYVTSAIAILISCLGLFGLVSFTITSRTKEMGIRKVLGASMTQISQILTGEFLILIAIALMIAIPITYYFVEDWINGYAYRIELSWWLFLSGGLISLLTAVLVIGGKIWRASKANPVQSLRYE